MERLMVVTTVSCFIMTYLTMCLTDAEHRNLSDLQPRGLFDISTAARGTASSVFEPGSLWNSSVMFGNDSDGMDEVNSGFPLRRKGDNIQSDKLMYPEHVQINNRTDNISASDNTIHDGRGMSKQSVDQGLGYAHFVRTGIVPTGKSGSSMPDTGDPPEKEAGVGAYSDINTSASHRDDKINQQESIIQTMPAASTPHSGSMEYNGSQFDSFIPDILDPDINPNPSELFKDKHSDKQLISTAPFLLEIPANDDMAHPEGDSFLLDTPPIEPPNGDHNPLDISSAQPLFHWPDGTRNFPKNARAAGWYSARTSGIQDRNPVAAPALAHSVQLRQLYIGGLFELSGSYVYGRSELEAALMAIRHINQQRYIHGYELVLLPNDTRGDPGYGADAFFDFVYCKPQLVMLVGTADSEVAKTLAEIVRYWNLLLVSYAATSPALSEREKYPTFYRLAPADSSYNAARKTFIQHFKWSTVAALHEDVETFTLAMSDMYKEFNKENITVKASLTFRTIGDDLQDKLTELKNEDARIIIGSFREDTARHVFCQAYQQGMYGQQYVWMLLGSYRDHWWLDDSETTNCTHAQLSEAVNGYFSVSSMNRLLGNGRSISGYKTDEFLDEYGKLNITSPRSPHAQLTYDSVWTIALTLRKAMEHWSQSSGTQHRLEDFDYITGTDMKKEFFRIMADLDFEGVSGPVSFDGPDRQSVIVIEQNQDGEQKKIGMFNPDNNTLDLQCLDCRVVQWPDGQVPADQYITKVRLIYIQSEAFYTVSAVAGFGIYLAVGFLSFNLHHRKLRYIKLSSPKLNNVAVIGCILVYLSVILLGMDQAILEEHSFSYICTARAFLLAAGFSLAFGAMFTKTYRVHQIFRGCHSGLVKSKLLKDKQLLFIIITLLIIDAAIISLWITIDPMYRIATNLTIEPSPENKDLLIIPQLLKCHSDHIVKWTGVMYAYKGLLLLFGVYMAWETRHVKIPALNDSQYIGLSIYNVVLSSVTVVALSNLISDRPTLSYSLVAALIILSTTTMLCLLFLPKIYAIVKHNGAPVVATSGLTVEANTRRFVVDEKRELYYRAEVQNRVHKRELIELDQEITRLERVLEVTNATILDDFLSLIDEKKADGSTHSTQSACVDHHEVQRQESATDVDDITSLPDLQPVTFGPRHKLEKQDSGFHTLSFKNHNFLPHATVAKSTSVPVSTEDEFCARDSYLNMEYEQTVPYLAHDKNHPASDQHSSANLRRQNNYEGDMEENTSLLANGEMELALFPCLKSTCCDHTNMVGSDVEIDLQTSHSKQDNTNNSVMDVHNMNDLDKCKYDLPEYVSVADHETSSQNKMADQIPSAVKSHRLAKVRADVLKRELARIQQELKSLGELELEVSYV